MRIMLAASLALAALATASPARADCIGPFECFCARTSSTGPVAVALVTSSSRQGDQTELALEIESVHGTAATSWQAGDTVSASIWQELDVGARVLVEPADQTGVNAFSVTVEQDDGSVDCSGFSSADLTLTDVIEVRLAEDCYAALTDKGATYESPPCNDVVTGPFSCRAGTAADGALLLLLGLGGFGLRRRWVRA